MATTTNYSWTTPDDTALVKDGALAIRTLGSSVDTTVKNLNPETTLGDIAYRSSTANTNTRLAIGTTGQVLTVSGGVPSWATPGGGATYAIFTDKKASGVAGGTFTSGAQRTRDLNTTQFNNITSASLASNQVTLPAGTYYAEISAIAFRVDQTQARLQNITDGTTTILGQTMCSGTGNSTNLPCLVKGAFTITGTKTFEVQHICNATGSGNGFGLDAGFGDNIYTIFAIAKVG